MHNCSVKKHKGRENHNCVISLCKASGKSLPLFYWITERQSSPYLEAELHSALMSNEPFFSGM